MNTWARVVTQQVQLPIVLASYTREDLTSCCSTSYPSTSHAPEKAAKIIPSAWATDIHKADPNGFPGCWV